MPLYFTYGIVVSSNKTETDYIESNVDFLMAEVQRIQILLEVVRRKKNGESDLGLPKRSDEPNLEKIGTYPNPNRGNLYNLGITREYPEQALCSPIKKQKSKETSVKNPNCTKDTYKLFSPIRRPREHQTGIYSPISYAGTRK